MFEIRTAAGLICQGELESSASEAGSICQSDLESSFFLMSFPTSYANMGLKAIPKKERGFCGTETGFFWRTESSKLGLRPNVVRRWGGQGGGNRGVDSSLITFFRCALSLWPSSDLPVIKKQTMPPKPCMMVPWLSISTKPSVVTWNFMNVTSIGGRAWWGRGWWKSRPPIWTMEKHSRAGPAEIFLPDGNEGAN